MNIEEKKRLAEFMGRFNMQTFFVGEVSTYNLWTPELGGDDLSEVLDKLTIQQEIKLGEKLKEHIDIDFFEVIDGDRLIINTCDIIDIGRFFCDNKNAPTIVKAILEVIK